jgi:excisionase family DNA binding protein
METLEKERWVSAADVAEHLGQPVTWVRKYAPLIPHVRVGRPYRFRLSEVDAWMEQWRGGDEV